MAGRPKKKNVRRDKSSGRSRGETGHHPETIARRERELEEAGIVLEFVKVDASGRRTIKRTATDALSGTTIGKLLLRWRQSPGRPDGISQDHYDTAEAWLKLCHRHAGIMGYRINIGAASLEIGGGTSTKAGPSADEAASVRKRWKACYSALGKAGSHEWSITSAVVLQGHPIDRMTIDDVGALRAGLNAIGRVLRS